MTVTFNGVRLSDYMTIGRIQKDILPPRDIKLMELPEKAGAYFMGVKEGVRTHTVPYRVKAASYEDLQDRMDEIGGLLDTSEPKPLIYDREPGKTYYAIVSGETNYSHTVTAGRGELTFLIVDPYKKGRSYNVTVQDATRPFRLDNEANNAYAPVFTVLFTEPSSYFSLISPEGNLMIGSPEGVDQPAVKPLTTIMSDRMDDLAVWSTSGIILDYGTNSGSFRVDEAQQFTVADFGTDSLDSSNSFHGPAIRRALSEPLQNFRVEFSIEFISGYDNNGRIELILMDNSGYQIGKLVLWDRYRVGENTTGHIYAGNMNDNDQLVWSEGRPDKYAWNNFFGKLNIRRERQPDGRDKWEASISQTDSYGYYDYDTNVYSGAVYLPSDRFGAPLGSVQLHFSKFGTQPGATMNGRHLTIQRINDVNQETETRELFQPGDELRIDHQKGVVLLNGQVFMNDFDPMSRFFKVPPGGLTVDAYASTMAGFNITAEYSERWK